MANKKTNIIKFPAAPSKLERQVEAILFAASEPLDIETIEKRIQSNSNIKKILENIKKTYKNRGINLVCINHKWSFRTADDLSKLMSLQKSAQKKLSKATIETLAIIVYHQPVTRSEIEEIRGVSFASNTLEILLELIGNDIIYSNFYFNNGDFFVNIKSQNGTGRITLLDDINEVYFIGKKIKSDFKMSEILLDGSYNFNLLKKLVKAYKNKKPPIHHKSTLNSIEILNKMNNIKYRIQ